MNILVTGGLGYIGSHTIIELINNKHNVIIVDNLTNSKIEVLSKLEMIIGFKLKHYLVDVTDELKLEQIFINNKIDGVIHFAGLKSVSESVTNPIIYYQNNLLSTIILSKLCIKYKIEKLVFSSSATVYGEQLSPLKENMKLMKTVNPYGETKAMSERILTDIVSANNNFNVAVLRYFNPIGAHKSGLIGENPIGLPNNLMPYISKVAKGELPILYIYGNDYKTIDGTGVRDYIHVVDIANGHVNAIEFMKPGFHVFNLGTGKGTSVLELVNAFEKTNNISIHYEFVKRRPGDIDICFADCSKAEQELLWKAKLGIEDMVEDAWRFELQNI